jgi:hypothetical protein
VVDAQGRRVERIPFIIGVNIGQQQDSTAIVSVEMEARILHPGDSASGTPALSDTHFLVRDMQRLPPATDDARICAMLAALVRQVHTRSYRFRLFLVCGQAGGGRPLVQLLRKTFAECGLQRICPISHVTITGNARADARVLDGMDAVVGEAVLAQRVQHLVHTKRIHAAPTSGTEAVGRELAAIEITLAENVHDLRGGRKVGQHGDYGIALALACMGDLVGLGWGRESSGPEFLGPQDSRAGLPT